MPNHWRGPLTVMSLVVAASLVVGSSPALALTTGPAARPAAAGLSSITASGGSPSSSGTCSGVRYPEPLVGGGPGAGGGPEGQANEGALPPTPVVPGGVVGSGKPSVILPPGAQGDPKPDDLVLGAPPVTVVTGPFQVVNLIAEPQVAVAGERMLVTWNEQAAQSWDGGKTFQYIDPGTFCPSADDGFCCDQLAAYLPDHDLWVWVLQYWPSPDPVPCATDCVAAAGNNRVRVAVVHGDDAFDKGAFTFWDVTAQGAGYDNGIWLDQPKIGWTDEGLFLSANAFTPEDANGDAVFVASVVWRFPIAELVAGDVTDLGQFTTNGYLDAGGSPLAGPFPVRDAGPVEYLAAHVDPATLGVWGWQDGSNEVTYREITSRTTSGQKLVYPSGTGYACPATGSANPKVTDWCAFEDDRITAGWRSDDRLGFAWTVRQSDGGALFPWVWAIELDPAKLDACADDSCIVDYPGLYIADRAIAFATIVPNERGDLGGVVLAGGGPFRLTCFAVQRDHDAPSDAGWHIAQVAASDTDSPYPRSGDYLGAALSSDGLTWVGSCMTLHPNIATSVHVARFGRRSDGAP